MKIRALRAELFHAGGRAGGRTKGQTEMTKLIVAFRNFANVPNHSTYTSAYYTTGIINFTSIKLEVHQEMRLVCKSYQCYSSS
jgi:hypothetical protein